MRLGIGKPEEKSRVEGYVLEPFRTEELSLLPDVIQTAAGAVTEIILFGMEKAMAKYHKKNICNSLKEEDE